MKEVKLNSTKVLQNLCTNEGPFIIAISKGSAFIRVDYTYLTGVRIFYPINSFLA